MDNEKKLEYLKTKLPITTIAAYAFDDAFGADIPEEDLTDRVAGILLAVAIENLGDWSWADCMDDMMCCYDIDFPTDEEEAVE